MGLHDWMAKKNQEWRRRALGDRDAHAWHSGSYHRYFEGYTEKRIVTPDGRERIERVYTGTWYRQDLSGARYVLLRCAYLLLLLAMTGTVALAGWAQGSGGRAFYTVIPEMATLGLLCYVLYILLVSYFFAPRRMTAHDYKASSVALKTASRLLCAAFALDAAAALLDMLCRQPGHTYVSVPLTVACFLAGAGLGAVMGAIERRVPYVQEDNPERAHAEEGVMIGEDGSPGLGG